MLELNHPQTKHIFTASGLLGAVLERARKMTVAPTFGRRELLAECQPVLEEMRRLNSEHFESLPFIFGSIEQLGRCLYYLSELVTETFLAYQIKRKDSFLRRQYVALWPKLPASVKSKLK